MNRYELQKTWSKITLTRAMNESIELTNKGRLNDTVFAVLCLIAFKPYITITTILNHPYFKDMSLTTIKRAIGTLDCEGFITFENGEDDKRERLISIKEVV